MLPSQCRNHALEQPVLIAKYCRQYWDQRKPKLSHCYNLNKPIHLRSHYLLALLLQWQPGKLWWCIFKSKNQEQSQMQFSSTYCYYHSAQCLCFNCSSRNTSFCIRRDPCGNQTVCYWSLSFYLQNCKFIFLHGNCYYSEKRGGEKMCDWSDSCSPSKQYLLQMNCL